MRPPGNYHGQIEAAFDEELLQEAMATVRQGVAPHTWEAFRLTALERQSGAEVARRVNMPVMHVYVARQRVQQMLRQEVERLQRVAEEPHGT